MKKIGLTGGIGSGKSIISKCFSSIGVPIYNSDIEAKKLLNRSHAVQEQLISAFGKKIFTNGKIDKKKFSDAIYKNEESLKKSNEIIHPAVKSHFDNWVKINSKHDYIIKEAAIMYESGSHKEMDKIITVFSPEKIREERLLERPGLTSKTLHKIIESQISEEEKIERSDFTIYNDEVQLIIPQILAIHKEILKNL